MIQIVPSNHGAGGNARFIGLVLHEYVWFYQTQWLSGVNNTHQPRDAVDMISSWSVDTTYRLHRRTRRTFLSQKQSARNTGVSSAWV